MKVYHVASVDSYKTIIQDVKTNLQLELREINITPKNQQDLINKWNSNRVVYPEDKTLVKLFEEQVVKSPNSFLIYDRSHGLTYAQVNCQANKLARLVKLNKSIKPESLIILCLDRNVNLVISILAVLKACCAYVPVDPEFPDERIKYILEETGSKLILTNRNQLSRINHLSSNTLAKPNVISIDETEVLCKLSELEDGNLDLELYPSNLTYIIYTSGTTGKPKGVMVENKSIVNLIWHQIREFKDSFKSSLLSASYTFDSFVEQMWGAVLVGGKLVLVTTDELLDPNQIQKIINQHEITCLNIVCSLLQTIKLPKQSSIQTILTGSEAFPKGIVKQFLNDQNEIVNTYGPTETTITSHQFIISKADSVSGYGTVPIGRQVSNLTSYILDDNKKLLPFGSVGELYIGGDGVTRGYLNRFDLTAERFMHNPFQTAREKELGINSRIYKTGDLCRFLPDGNIEYIGRNDNQIKIRGFRVELGEIENIVLQNQSIHQTAVIDIDEGVDKKLVCYFIATEDSELAKMDELAANSHLRDVLNGKLPKYMVPVKFIKLDKLPLLVSGKLNRNLLPKIDFSNNAKVEYIAPQTKEENTLVCIWKEILSKNLTLPIGLKDNFFHLGGNSLLLVKMLHLIDEKLNHKIKIEAIFSDPTIGNISSIIQSNNKSCFAEGTI